MRVSVQLYTVRELTAKDFAAAVKQVADIGYRAVELAGYGNLKSAKEARKALDDAGLEVSGAHASIQALEDDLEKVLDDTETLGNRNLICPWMPEDRRRTAEGWKQSALALNKIGEGCRKRGVKFAYHNHSFEFQKFDGKSGLEILFENSDPELVYAQLDVYWVKHGGDDPVAWIDKLGQRALLLHLKDMAPGEERRFAPVGEGTIDFAAILAAAEKAGTQWGAVEQDDTYEIPALEAIRISLANLKKLGARV